MSIIARESNTSHNFNLPKINLDQFKITNKGKAQRAINASPLSGLQKLILSVLLEFLNPNLILQNIFPQINKILERMGSVAPTRRWLQRSLNKIVELGFLDIFDTYQYLPDGSLNQLSNSFYFTPLLLALGTEHEEEVREYVLNSRGHRPSVLMRKENLSFSDAFKKGTAKKIIGSLKPFHTAKKSTGGDGLQATLIPKDIYPPTKTIKPIDQNTSIEINGFDRGVNKSINQFFEDIETKKAEKAENRRLLAVLKPTLERFEKCCHRSLTQLEMHKLAGGLRRRIERQEGTEESYLETFDVSLKIIESWSLLQRSEITSLGRLYYPEGLNGFFKATKKELDHAVSLVDYDEETTAKLVADYAQEKGAKPIEVVGDLCGPEPARKLTLVQAYEALEYAHSYFEDL